MDNDDLIPGYLIHESYEDTPKAFDQSDHSAKEITESNELADGEKWMDVIFLLKESLPAVLNSKTGLLFYLLSDEFVKILTKSR
ncbi:hypothetical protein HanIR_Chr12g0566221 [Helianthus annuus]|nr:hypothetical protein HanIR_Chr12g0566221 [Helianthus annuus]